MMRQRKTMFVEVQPRGFRRRMRRYCRRSEVRYRVERLEGRWMLAGDTLSTGIIGTAFADLNADGVLSEGEDLSGVRIELYRDGDVDGQFDSDIDELVDTVTSGEGGAYTFVNLDPDPTYFLVVAEQNVEAINVARHVSTIPLAADVGLVIDQFVTEQFVTADIGTPPGASSLTIDQESEVLGGERDMLVRGQSALRIDSQSGFVTYVRGGSVQTANEMRIVWDGQDGDAQRVASGLGLVDLTFNDQEAFLIRAGAIGPGHESILQLHQSDQSATVTFTLPEVSEIGQFDSVIVPLTEFVGGLNLQQVDAIELLFDVPINSQGAVDSISLVAPLSVDIPLNVISPNVAPMANDDLYVSTDIVELNIDAAAGVLANDSDPDGETLQVLEVTRNPEFGTLELNPDGGFSYVPQRSGTDSFDYLAVDPGGLTSSATVTIVVQEPNQPPSPADDFYLLTDIRPLELDETTGVLNNDLEPDGETLRVRGILQPPTLGEVNLRPDGSLTYTPTTTGTDTFTYEVEDESGLTAQGTVTIVIQSSSEPLVPNAINDEYSLVEATQLTVRSATGVLANDGNPDDAAIQVELVQPPRFGLLTLATDGAFSYTPNRGFIGSDGFTYLVRGSSEATATASVVLDVMPDGLAPYIFGTVFLPDADPPETIEDVDVSLFLDNGDRRFDPNQDERIAQTRSGADGRFGFSMLDIDGMYYVMQPAQDAGGVQLERRTSDLIALNDSTTILDLFTVAQSVELAADMTTNNDSLVASGDDSGTMIGNQRDLFLERTGGAAPISLDVNSLAMGPSVVLVMEPDAEGTARLVWDGSSGADSLGLGLGSADLTNGGVHSGFVIDARSQSLGALMSIRIYEGATDRFSEVTVPIAPETFDSGTQFIPFSSFSGNASPERIDALELRIESAGPGGERVVIDRFGVSGVKIVELGTSSQTTEVDLQVEVRLNSDRVVAGSEVVYEVLVSNLGANDVSSVEVNVPVPAGVGNTSFESQVVGQVVGHTSAGSGPVRDIVDITAGATLSYIVTGTVRADRADSLEISALLEVLSDVVDTDPTNNAAQLESEVVHLADLVVDKTVDATTVGAGDIIEYTLVVKNDGPSDAVNISVLDVVPAMLEDVTYSAEAGEGVVGNLLSGTGDLLDENIDMPSGSQLVYRLRGRVSDSAVGILTNQAEVQPAPDFIDPNPDNNRAAVTSSIVALADLSLSLITETDPLIPGQTVSYVLTVENDGPTASESASLVNAYDDAFFQDVRIVSVATEGVVGNTLDGQGNLGDQLSLPSGGSVQYTIDAMIRSSAIGVLVNEASIIPGSTVIDPNPDNNTLRDERNLTPTADVRVTVQNDATVVQVGERFTYSIEVTNLGPSDATGVTLRHDVPDSIVSAEFQSDVTGLVTGATDVGQGSLDELLDLPTGSTVRYVYIGQIDANTAGQLVNGASVAVNRAVDPNLENNSSTDDTAIVSTSADLVVKIESDVDSLRAGSTDIAQVEVVIANNGPDEAEGTIVTGSVSDLDGINISELVASVGTFTVGDAGANFVWQVGSLAPGVEQFLTYRVDASNGPSLIDRQFLQSASATSSTPLVNTVDDQDSDIVSIRSESTLAILATASNDRISAGADEVIDFELAVTNEGPSTATSVLATLELPPEFELVGTEGTGGQLEPNERGGTLEVDQLSPGQTIQMRVRASVPASVNPGSYATITRASHQAGETVEATTNVTVIAAPTTEDGGAASGVLWHDINQDGNRQLDEPPLSGWQVFADANRNDVRDPDEPIVVTDTNGRYALDLDEGLHTIRLVPQPAWELTFPRSRFDQATPIAASPATGVSNLGRALQAADLNGDGAQEVIVASEYSNRVLTYRRDTTGEFVQFGSVAVGLRPRSIAVLDVDQDGDLDVAVATVGGPVGDERNNGISILVNDGMGGLVLGRSYPAGNGPQHVIPVDTNNDGRLDLVSVSVRDGAMTLLLNREHGFHPALSVDIGQSATAVAGADINRDGRIDFAIVDFQADELVIVVNNQAGHLVVEQRLPVGDGPSGVTAGDWNGDGAVDWAVTSYLADQLAVVSNDGAGRFSINNIISLADGARPNSVTSADLNRDSRLDAIVANQELNSINVFYSDEVGELLTPLTVLPGVGPQSVAVADLTGNGRLDIAAVVLDLDEDIAGLRSGLALIADRAESQDDVRVVSGQVTDQVDFGLFQLTAIERRGPNGAVPFSSGRPEVAIGAVRGRLNADQLADIALASLLYEDSVNDRYRL